ncbi:MAG: hypothetical protein ACKV0T_17915 [Planctomycetales bacterium]
MTPPITIKSKARFQRGRDGPKVLKLGAATTPAPRRGRVPCLARPLSLALRFETLIRNDEVRDHADLARLGHVTRARLSQIMDLLLLAPDIQEALLFLPAVETGDDPVHERQLRGIVAVPDWGKQRRMWKALCQSAG